MQHNQSRSPWELVGGLSQRCEELWNGGYSAAVIARMLNEEFSLSITRNAVIGRVNRRKLPPRKVGRRKGKTSRWPSLRKRHDNSRVIFAKLASEPEPLKISVFELKANHCRFMRDEFYCGHPTVNGSSWCEHHYRICFTPYQRRAA